MIYDMLYRDGANYKTYFRAEFPDNRELQQNDEVLMGESGLTVYDFLELLGLPYSEYDHNILEVQGVSKDQSSPANVSFVDDIEYHYAVDIPSLTNIQLGSADVWENVDYFKTKEEAIKWAMENLGADENGMICVISSF